MSSNISSLDCDSIRSRTKTRSSEAQQNDLAKLRTACDGCHMAKIRCTGGTPCGRCARDGLQCHYSVKAKIGKPRGSMNKKTIERLRRMNEEAAQEQQSQHAPQTPPSTAGSLTTTPRQATTAIPPLPGCSLNSINDSNSSSHTSREAVNPHRSPDLGINSPPFQDFNFAVGDLDPMDTWLPDVDGNCFDYPPTSTAPNLSSQQKLAPDLAADLSGKEAFNKIASQVSFPCLSSPGYRDQTFTRDFSTHPNVTMLDVGNHPNIVERDSSYNRSVCSCLSDLTTHLCALQSLSPSSDHAPGLDALLVQSQQIMPSIKNVFICQPCMRDTQVLLLVNMVLARLMKWAHISVCVCEARCIAADIRLGKYHASAEVGVTVTRMLFQMLLADFEKIVTLFGKTISHSGREEVDESYLSLQVRNLRADIERLTERAFRPSR